MSIRAYMSIMAERDAAIRERNMALEERKRAFAERDMAMLQRDAAIVERNSAMQERDGVIAALQFQENSMNDTNIPPDSPGDAIAHGANGIHNQQQMHHMAYMAESIYSPVELPTSSTFQTTGVMSETAKPRKVRHTKEAREISTKSARSQRVGKNDTEGRSKQLIIVTSNDGEGQDLDNTEDDTWKDNLGLNQVNFDESAMPVPVCSCTGVPQPCYKWGNGGWQSACCTTTMSMYPLPQASGKKYSRVVGRKMSGSAFTKLLNRLVIEGHDLSAPVELKDHWAKHGTNRYSTLK